MIDCAVLRLIEQVIDSPLKLQLLLMFCENLRMEGTASQIAQRAYRDIWSTREALQEMTEDGILATGTKGGEPVYRYRPRVEYLEPIVRLCQAYNEPIERDVLQQKVRETASYARYRRGSVGALDMERSRLSV